MTSLSGITEFFTGQYAILAWFLLAIAVFYIPAMALYFLRRRHKAAAFLRKHPDAAKVRILRGKVTGELTVYAVDDANPVLAGKGIHTILYLAPGTHILKMTYRYDKISLFGKLYPRYANANRTVQGKTASKRFTVQPYGEYTLSYDIKKENYHLAAESDDIRRGM